MTVGEIADKVIPPLVVALVIGACGMLITVYIIEARVATLEKTNGKQWEFISEIHERAIRNEERVMCEGKHSE